jgi:hypothetical protein
LLSTELAAVGADFAFGLSCAVLLVLPVYLVHKPAFENIITKILKLELITFRIAVVKFVTLEFVACFVSY